MQDKVLTEENAAILAEKDTERGREARIRRVLDFLDKNEIAYELHRHPPLPTVDVALKYWKNINAKHCKNLFFRNHKGNRHYLVSFECHKSLAIHDLEKKLGQGKLSFASEQRMFRCLGLFPGSVSPFGLINDINIDKSAPDFKQKELFENGHRVRFFIDSELEEADKISFHPGDNTASIVLSSDDFKKFLSLWGGEYSYLKMD